MKILLADDDPMVRELLTDFLSDLGHEVAAAENGQELIKLALAARPDLVIADMRMPEMMGNSMIAMIDLYPPLAGMPVIMVTGVSKMEIDDAGIPPEIPVLFKPVDFEKLAAEINKIVNRKGGAGV